MSATPTGRGERPPPTPRPGFPFGISAPGLRAIGYGGVLVVFCAGLTIYLVTEDGPWWRGVVALSVAASIVGSGLFVRWRALRLWRTGECCEGEVERAWKSESHSGSSGTSTTTPWVAYRYVVDGQPWLAEHRTDKLWDEGPIWVVYDPRKPGRSMPVGGARPA